MNPLPTSQKVMTWLCICPADKSTDKIERIGYITFSLIVNACNLVSLLTSVAFALKFVSTNFEASLYALLQIAATAALLNLSIVGLINRHHVAAIFTELTEIYTANKNESSFRFLAEATNKSEWLWEIYFKFGMGGSSVNIFVSTVGSIIYCFYKYGVFNVEHLYTPHKLLLPWNQTTPYGYFGEIAYSIVGILSYFILNGAVLILFNSLCWCHQAFYKRFHDVTSKLDQPENKRNANKILGEILHYHITTKDWFLKSAEVYSPLVLIQLICNVVFVAGSVFELDLRVKHVDFEFFVLMNDFLVGTLNLFVYCYFGKLATESYEKMAECLYESNWHEKSFHLQKKFLLMIKNMQEPVVYHGFGVAVLNLATFVKVMRAVFSYYMMFKTLTLD